MARLVIYVVLPPLFASAVTVKNPSEGVGLLVDCNLAVAIPPVVVPVFVGEKRPPVL